MTKGMDMGADSPLVNRLQTLLAEMDGGCSRFIDEGPKSGLPTSRDAVLEAERSLAEIGLKPAGARLREQFDKLHDQWLLYEASLSLVGEPDADRVQLEELIGPVPDPNTAPDVCADREAALIGRAGQLRDLIRALRAEVAQVATKPPADDLLTTDELARLAGVARKTFLNRLSESRNADFTGVRPPLAACGDGSQTDSYSYAAIRPWLLATWRNREPYFPESFDQVRHILGNL